MGTLLPIIYAIWFFANIFLLVRSAKANVNKKWLILFASEIIALVSALILMVYYDGLPGGMFGGLTYMGEVISSMGAAIAQGGLLVISLVATIICKCKSK